ncbi:MAG: glycerophosphodiester phosphodiesterase family protein [Prevotella sp.]|nr:glycerophosphodiester phosphodiesterase family protein [Prevotella sp.]
MYDLRKQYIGHARHKGPAPENSLDLYRYLIHEIGYQIIEGDVVFTRDGVPILNHGVILDAYINGENIKINSSEITYNELMKYSLSPNSHIPISTVDDFVRFGYSNKVYIMLDLTFQKYTLSNYKTLYDIVKKNNMLEHTIWGDPDFTKLARINRQLICQVGGSWGRKLLIESFIKSFFCKKMIMSYSYYGGNIEQNARIVRWGHKLGFLMKVATINDQHIADRFWNIGTDLINTDTLTNN